jgi:Lrp/AsnC family transcriptional regulator for asnA, asnC and gidA
MSVAYVMISSELGHEEKVVEHLEKIEQIVEIFVVYGIYDIIAKVKFNERDELRNLILGKIREIEYIKSTETLETY